ncbi:MAG: CoA-binding protein [Nitrospinae bacterium]|nr:CoA-binding protein [Nitrospinota bacterium]
MTMTDVRPPEPEANPAPDQIRELLATAKTIAVIGISEKAGRPSLDVGRYLAGRGYTIYPVNPQLSAWEGRFAYASLHDIPGPVDIVDIFRKPGSIGELVPEIIAKRPRAAWLQLGIVNNEAAAELRAAGIAVVQDRCIKIDHYTLLGG